MTEAEWLACADDDPMWHSEPLWLKVGARQYQLYAAACCRRIWPLFPDRLCRGAVELLERFAEGACDRSALEQAEEGFHDYIHNGLHEGLTEAQNMAFSAAWHCVSEGGYRLASLVADNCHRADRESRGLKSGAPGWAEERRAYSDLIREMIGNPFRPALVQPAWLTPAVTSLATAAYEERSLPSGELDLARLAVLADALEEAGCSDPDLLGHLRSPGPHVRGCWAIDLILGKQ